MGGKRTGVVENSFTLIKLTRRLSPAGIFLYFVAYRIIMEVTYSALKQKDVINLVDGKHLGKVCDITFTFPENKVQGFTVTGCKGFRFSKQEIFLPIKDVVKIGADAVLVKLGKEERPDCPPPKPDCPPKCPPPCPPCPPQFGGGRRDYGEYE